MVNKSSIDLSKKTAEKVSLSDYDIKKDFSNIISSPFPNIGDEYKPEKFLSFEERNGYMVGIFMPKHQELECFAIPLDQDGHLKNEYTQLHAQSFDYSISSAGGRTDVDMPRVTVSMTHYTGEKHQSILYFSDELERSESIKKLTPEALLKYCLIRKNFIEGPQGKKCLDEIKQFRQKRALYEKHQDLCDSSSFPEFVVASIYHLKKRIEERRHWNKAKSQAENKELQNTDKVIDFIQNVVGEKAPQEMGKSQNILNTYTNTSLKFGR